MTAHRDIELTKGTDFYQEITVEDREGNPIDLNGYSVRLEARDEYSSDPFFILNDIATNGNKIDLVVSDDAIESVPVRGTVRQSVYVLEVEKDGNTTRLYSGNFDIRN